MPVRNETVFSGVLSFGANSAALGTLTVPALASGPLESGQYLVSVRNRSTQLTLIKAECLNVIPFATNGDTDVSVAATGTIAVATTGGTYAFLVQGWLLGKGGKLAITKSGTTNTAFDVEVDVRRA